MSDDRFLVLPGTTRTVITKRRNADPASRYRLCRSISGGTSCDCGGPYPAHTRTAAGYRTTTGHRISISICFAAPPAVSRLHIDVPDFPERLTVHPVPIAVHGDSVLVNVNIVEDDRVDAVVYCAGAVPSRPPSLSLLPPCYFTLKGEDEERWRMVYPQGRVLEKRSTGFLRCGGGGEFVVAFLKLNVDDVEEAELCVFRRPGWELKRLPVRHGTVRRDDMWGWQPDTAIAVGGRYLCWGDLSRGIIFWDALADGPELQYVPLPLAEPLRRCRGREEYALYRRSRSLCVVAGEELKFVDVAPRCCCGGLAATRCPRSKYAFRITTWTLRMEDMTWWQDGEMDAAELWALPGYGGLPRVPVEYPVVSMDEPGVLCLLLCENHHDGGREHGDDAVWLIKVDTSRKVLLSVARYGGSFHHEAFLPSEVSKHFGTPPPGIINRVAAAAGGVDQAMTNAAYQGAYRPDASRGIPSYPTWPANSSAPIGSYEHADRGSNNLAVCQLCGKVGHVASCCFKRFQHHFFGLGNDGRYTHRQIAAATLTQKRNIHHCE
uniref:Uncharacterized protein n=1 Tax=Avena sativa TaxID=4498 RepID=A0ACD5VB93_AVESA